MSQPILSKSHHGLPWSFISVGVAQPRRLPGETRDSSEPFACQYKYAKLDLHFRLESAQKFSTECKGRQVGKFITAKSNKLVRRSYDDS
jgi:hypothetical protein